MDGVEAGDDRRVEHLFEGVLARLAGLELDEVEDLLLAVEEEVMEAQENLRPLGERPHRPILLGESQPRLGEDDVLRRRAWQRADQGVVEGGADRDGVARARGDDQADEGRQAIENRRPARGGIRLVRRRRLATGGFRGLGGGGHGPFRFSPAGLYVKLRQENDAPRRRGPASPDFSPAFVARRRRCLCLQGVATEASAGGPEGPSSKPTKRNAAGAGRCGAAVESW